MTTYFSKSPITFYVFSFPGCTYCKYDEKTIYFCGLLGWCLEIFWTGLQSLQRRQLKLMGHSSIWMFPIYGMAFLFAPISRLLRKKSVWVRGSVYAGGIFLTEYLSGMFLKKRGICPWDYSHARLNVKWVIMAGLRAGLVS